MKSFYTLILLLLASMGAKAQGGAYQPEQDCINAIPVCQSVYQQANSYIGGGIDSTELNPTNQGCLGAGERHDVWYIINISSSGILEFTITPNAPGDDYDFAVWDISGQGCQAIYNGLQPIRCNYYGADVTTLGITGLSAAGTQASSTTSRWSTLLPVTAGQTLVLNVSNFSRTQSGYRLDFTPSTASIFDNQPPSYKSTFIRCGTVADSIEVTMSEPIRCASLAPDGSDFELRDASGQSVPGVSVISAKSQTCQRGAGSTINYRLKFSRTLAAGTYQLAAKLGNDGNTLIDNCNNQQLVGDTISFTMYPPGPPVVASHASNPCSHITLTFNKPVKCSTVSPDGSDFFVVGPSPVAVTHADASICDAFGLIKTIDVHFDKSIEIPGTYVVNFKKGTDGDGLVDTCSATVVAPYRFDVTDAGVTATANPPILCNPGYATLTATTGSAPYGALARCGTNGGPDLVGATLVTDTVGAFADTTSGATQPTPFDGSQANVRTQMLLSAAELQAAGLSAGRFKSVSFFIGKKNTTKPFRNLNIKMGCTQLTSLAGFVPSLPIVYSAAGYATRLGENKFTLTDAYDWDGQSNLIVELCYSNPDSTANAFDQVAFENTANNSVYRRSSGATTISGCAFANNSGSGGAATNRPALAFGFLKPPTPAYHWLWTPSNWVEDSTAATTLAYVPKGPRQYTIRAKDQYGCYRRGTTQVDISIRNPYGHPDNDTAICIGGSAHLLVGNGVRYQWFPATGLSCTDCPNPIATPKQTTTYYAAIFDQHGCSDTLKATVNVNTLPVVSAGKDTSVLYSFGVPLYAVAPAARFYAWTPTTGLNYANVPNPIASPLETTDYVVQVIDTNYCISYDTVTVRVRRDMVPVIPNAFSPNGDATNDVFKVVNLGINKLVEMRIYNRWGVMVCNTTDNSRGWDGTYQGVLQDAGVYKYLIRVVKPDGTAQEFKGDVTLVR